jgi:hypothetical protein
MSKTITLTKKQEEKFSDGTKNLRDMEAQIESFTEPMIIVQISTTGRWETPDSKIADRNHTRSGFDKTFKKDVRQKEKQIA